MGLYFAIIPKCTANGVYIATVEHACSKLNQGETEELRVEVKHVLKKVQLSKSNITNEEMKAMKELNKDDTRMILTEGMRVALVVMDKDGYIKKAEDLLNQPTYELIPADPTTRQKPKLINLVEAWYSLEQYIGLKEDKLSSTTVDFIRSEGNLKTKHLYWLGSLRCANSVKTRSN